MTGDEKWLVAGGQKFLSIFTENSTDKTLGGIIILHGVGVHPNWVDVVQPIRTVLTEYGWHTLSLQMPILANDAEYTEYKPLFVDIAPRINAGIGYLKEQDVKNIIIVGHSMGATMAAYYMANDDREEVKALVAIGAAGVLFKDPEKDFLQSIKVIKKPILDISGVNDIPDVVKTKQLKADVAKKSGNTNYKQVEIEGANHFLVGKESEVVQVIRDWIKPFGT